MLSYKLSITILLFFVFFIGLKKGTLPTTRVDHLQAKGFIKLLNHRLVILFNFFIKASRKGAKIKTKDAKKALRLCSFASWREIVSVDAAENYGRKSFFCKHYNCVKSHHSYNDQFNLNSSFFSYSCIFSIIDFLCAAPHIKIAELK